MDETRALLDALMGPSRNTKKDASAAGGEPDFVNKNVCKNFLVGFCPHDWFTTNRRPFKPCYKIHSDTILEQFKAHPDADKYRVEWEEDFVLYLEVAARECDAFIAREKPKCRQKGGGGRDFSLPPEVKSKCDELEQKYASLIKQSEKLADEAQVSRSQEHMQQAQTVKEELDGIKARHTTEFPGEDICEVCGVRYLLAGTNTLHDKTDHMRGKTHQGFAQIRDKILELKGKKRQWEKLREKNKEWFKNYIRAKKKEEDKEREQEREKEKEKERARDKERKEEKDRSGRDRSRSRDKDKSRKDKDRDRRRGSRSPRNKRRDKSKDRGKRSLSPRREVVTLPGLWAQLCALPEDEREEATAALQDDVKEALEEWLVERMKARGAA